MDKVKEQIVRNLQEALVACNNADIALGDEYCNDLDARVSRQASAYGYISNAIAEIAGKEVIEFWIENGYFDDSQYDACTTHT